MADQIILDPYLVKTVTEALIPNAKAVRLWVLLKPSNIIQHCLRPLQIHHGPSHSSARDDQEVRPSLVLILESLPTTQLFLLTKL